MTERDQTSSEGKIEYVFDELIENDHCLCSVLPEKRKSDKAESSKTTHYLNIAVNSEILPQLADTIKDFFESGTQNNTVVGLTGHYGCGKTSFCRFLEAELTKIKADSCNNKDNKNQSRYIFFFYDLWKHHHDNLKKSIVTELSAYLLSEGILEDKDYKNVQPDKLLDWMSRHDVGSKKNLSKISLIKFLTIPCVISIVLLVLGSSLEFFSFWNELVGWGDFYIGEGSLLRFKYLLWSFLIILIIFIFIYLARPCYLIFFDCISNKFNSKKVLFKRFFGKFLTHAHVEYSENTCNDDLSVRDFQNWLVAIYRNLTPHRIIILVLDNIDRLPENMIKDFFASIHDLFYLLNSQEKEKRERITSRIHVIIPFEYESVCKIFEKTPQHDMDVKRNINNTVKRNLNNHTQDLITN